jgi:hypothetical protein
MKVEEKWTGEKMKISLVKAFVATATLRKSSKQKAQVIHHKMIVYLLISKYN